MLAYAANRPIVAKRSSSPNAMLFIIAAHVAVIAAVISARMDLAPSFHPTRTIVDLIREPQPPEPTKPVEPRVNERPIRSVLDQPKPDIALPSVNDHPVDSMPSIPDGLTGPVINPFPQVEPVPVPLPTRIQARLLTPADELKPPYPAAKLLNGEEAVLRLRLTIDEHGRVVAVDPTGRADRVFLEAARRHLMTHWRYRPATEDGRAMTSTIVITLRFQLDG